MLKFWHLIKSPLYPYSFNDLYLLIKVIRNEPFLLIFLLILCTSTWFIEYLLNLLLYLFFFTILILHHLVQFFFTQSFEYLIYWSLKLFVWQPLYCCQVEHLSKKNEDVKIILFSIQVFFSLIFIYLVLVIFILIFMIFIRKFKLISY